MRSYDFHAREEALQVGGDDLFHPDKSLSARRQKIVRIKGLERDQTWQRRRDLDTGKTCFSGIGVANDDG
jgi:hypothetical protein